MNMSSLYAKGIYSVLVLFLARLQLMRSYDAFKFELPLNQIPNLQVVVYQMTTKFQISLPPLNKIIYVLSLIFKKN